MDYGIGVSNRYAFLEDNEDDLIIQDKKTGEVSSDDKKSVKKTDKAVAQASTKSIKKGPVTDAQKDQKKTYEDSSNEIKGRQGRGAAVVGRGGRGGGTGGHFGGFEEKEWNEGNDGEFVTSSRGNRSSRGFGRGGRGRSNEHDRERNDETYDGQTSSRGNRRGAGRGGRGRFNDQEREFENQENLQVSSRGIRSSRGTGRGGRMMDNDTNFEDWSEETHDNNGRHRSEGSVEFFGRGRGPRGGSSRGGFTRRRDHDRHSGSDRSGVKSMDKREGGGAHNWGSYKDEFEGEGGNQTDSGSIEYATENGNSTTAENGQGDANHNANDFGMQGDTGMDVVEVEVEPIKEEPVQFTLEQWKAMQQPRPTPTFNIRQPNEGEDPKWKKLVLKKKEEEFEEDEYEEGEDIWVPQRAGRLKRLTDIGFHFGETRDGERGFRRNQRNARGGGFGGADRNGEIRDRDIRERGERSGRGMPFRKDRYMETRRIDPPRVDDVNDFPTLGVF